MRTRKPTDVHFPVPRLGFQTDELVDGLIGAMDMTIMNTIEWRSVSDGLPAQRPKSFLVTDGAYLAEAWHDGDGVFRNTHTDALFEDVTYWADVPPLPKGE